MEQIVKFLRDYQPRFTDKEVPNSYKISSEDHYWISFYNRREELSKGSGEYHDQMTEIWLKEVNRLFND